jgi:hypothetical protein
MHQSSRINIRNVKESFLYIGAHAATNSPDFN